MSHPNARSKRLTAAKAARLVRAIVAIQECADCPDGLRIALDDARGEIDPWYEDGGGAR